jgi:hypothetical protein
MPERAFHALAAKLAAALSRGQHIVLWGPRGAGKTMLLNTVLQELGDVHCALSPATSSLDDITRALERAYSATSTKGLTRRAARSRLWSAADAEPGCVLLDHVTRVPSAMKGWLRRLRGGVVGVVLAVDVDSPRERDRLRGLKIGCTTLRMPPATSRTLTRLLVHSWELQTALPFSAPARRALVRAARGRPRWIMECAALASDPQYWLDGQPRVHLLAIDTEIHCRSAQN